MNFQEKIQSQFKCPKCNNRASVGNEISLSKVSDKIKLLGGGSGKYFLVSCSLCGFTEMYNMKLVVHDPESKPVGDPLPKPSPG